jgi:type VI secretion system secreted protein Hcp
MASLAYMKLSGVQGPGVIKDERQNTIPVIGLRHDVGTPPGETGASERLHHPIYVTKNIDYTTPALHRAMVDGTAFESGWIQLYHMPRSGDETNYNSITLTGVRVVSIRSIMPSTQVQETTDLHEYEEVGLIYQGINWTANPPPKGLEDGTYARVDTPDPEAKFGTEWLDKFSESEAKDILKKLEEEVTKQLKDEAKKKADALKEPKK